MTMLLQLERPPQLGDAKVDQWLVRLHQTVQMLLLQRRYVQYVLTTGFSQQIPAGYGLVLLLPAGALASGTLLMPIAAFDGFELTILSSQTVTSLTLTPASGQSIDSGASGTLTAHSAVTYLWDAAQLTWYKKV